MIKSKIKGSFTSFSGLESMISSSVFFVSMFLYLPNLFGQAKIEYTTTGTWTCPIGVTSVTIECWGGGGGGGGASGYRSSAGGGSGGAYVVKTNHAVVPGTAYTITVGAGGLGGAASSGAIGASGGVSWFGTSTTIKAVGGTGGLGAALDYQSALGGIAVVAGNTGGTTNFYGGNGATGQWGAKNVGYGGGGGGSAGSYSGGNSANGSQGGIVVQNGGAGANGRALNANGASATEVGGGGAGGKTHNNNNRKGGDGAVGKVAITVPSIWYNSLTGTNLHTYNPYTLGGIVSPNITVSGIGRGSGIVGVNSTDSYMANNWIGASLSTDKYFSFTMTPNSGFDLNLVTFNYSIILSSGTASYALRSSLDNFTNNIGTATVGVCAISLSAAAYQNVTGPITFRLYAWGASSSTVTLAVKDFSFMGATGGLPNFSSFTPSAGCAGSGTSVYISGSNLSSASSVKFNGVNAAFTVNSSSVITAILPSGATTGNITIAFPTGTITSPSIYTVNSLPTPSFTLTPGATTCTGVEVTYATQSGSPDYYWTFSGIADVDYIITDGAADTLEHITKVKWLTEGSRTTTVNYRINNCLGATAASYQMTVSASSTMQLTCPSNIINSTTSTTCNKLVSVPNPLVLGSCSTYILSWTMTGAVTASSPVTGVNYVGNYTFPLGVTTITYTATNLAAQVATCSFTVTVTDNTNPTIACQANASANVAASTCAASVATSNPTFSDNCSVSKLTWSLTGATVATSPVTGTNYVGTRSFNAGVTAVTYTVTDASGNTSSCSFNVTVNDNINPTIQCSGPLSAILEATSCTASVNTTNPVIADNCSVTQLTWTMTGATAASSPTSGMNNIGNYSFGRGITTIVYTASDAAGNIATCSFTVTVTDTIAPTIVCPANITVNVNAGSCEATVGTLVTPVTSDNCSVASVTNNHPSTTYSIGANTVIWTVTDGSGNTATCSQTVTVIDNINPTITCPANITANVVAGSCTATVASLGTPVTADNCAVASTTNNFNSTTFPIGITSVIWTTTDASGNTASCTQTVTVTDNINPTISCPSNITANVSAGTCTASVATPNATPADNCAVGKLTWSLSGATVAVSPATGINNVGTRTFNVGATTVTYVVSDVTGNTSTCSFTVTVMDNINPTITCPANITVNVNAGSCEATVGTLVTPVTSDNCSVASVTNNHPSTTYSIGANTVIWTVTDGSGNTATCSQTVTVIDNINPTITCPSSITASLGLNSCNASVATSNPVVSDNCSVSGLSWIINGATSADSPLTGMNFIGTRIFNPGTTTVVYTATDASGNVATCSFNVVVSNNVNPTITCPSSQTFIANSGCNSILDDFTSAATVVQNCGLSSSYEISQTPAAGTVLNGTIASSVTLLVTDVNGNSSSCAFNVQLVDQIAPVATMPTNQSIILNEYGEALLADYRSLVVATDGCSSNSQLNIVQTPAPGTQVWGTGNTTVNIVVTDASGNVFNGSFQVARLDITPPEITCPEDQQYLYDMGETMIVEDYIQRGLVIDNVTENPDVLIVQTPPAGTVINETGTTVITITATDLAGNVSSCTINVVTMIQTRLQFASTVSNYTEGNMDVALTVSLLNPAPTTPTSVNIVLNSVNATRLSGFSTHTVTFPAGSSTAQTAMIHLINNDYCDSTSEIVFSLQSPVGNNNPIITGNSTHVISLIDDDTILIDALVENAESGNLDAWVQSSAQAWNAMATGAVNGDFGIRHTATNASGTNWVSKPLNEMTLAGVRTEWKFNVNHFGIDPNQDDKFFVYLASSAQDLNAQGINGYAIGVNPMSATEPDIIKLWSVNNGILTELVSTGYDLGASNFVMGWKVVRDPLGLWSVYLDLDGGFDNLQFMSSATDETFLFADYFGVLYKHTAATSGQLAMDDISVTQVACSCTYYCLQSGTPVSPIFSVNPTGITGEVVFSKFSNVDVTPGNTLTLSKSVLVKDLIIDASGVINAGEHKIYVYGNVITNGAFNSGSGTVVFKGTNNQNISGSNPVVFNNILIDNNGGTVTLNSANETKLKGVATISKGTLATNDKLTLLSNAASTASIGVIADNANLNGKLTMQRYVVGMTNSNSGGYVGLGCPVQGSTLADWGADFITTGFVGATYPPPYSFNNISWYNESVAGNMNNGYVYATNITNTLNSDRGYFIYMQPGLQNIDVKGYIYHHELIVPLSYTNTGTPSADGYNLLVNQYPSEVDFKLISDNGAGISSYSIYDSESNNYKIYNAALNTGTAPRYIASSQAFFAKATGAGAYLKYMEYFKTNNGIAFERSGEGVESNIARAGFKISANNGSSDQSMLVLHNDATPAFDYMLDGGKLMSPSSEAVQCALVSSDNELLTLYARKSMSENFEIPVWVMIPGAGDYVFSVENITHVRNPGCICIEDLHTGAIIPMIEGQTMTLHSDSAFTGNRLVIRNMYSVNIVSKDITCYGQHNGEIQIENTDPAIQVTVTNNSNQVEYSGPASENITGLIAGVYQVAIQYPIPQCSAELHEVVVVEPMQPSVIVNSFMQGICGVGKGAEVSIEIQNFQNYNYKFIDFNGDVAYSGSSTDPLLSLHNIRGEKYHVVIEGECGTESVDVDLEDTDAVSTHILTDDVFVTVVRGTSQLVTIEQESENESDIEWNMSNGFRSNDSQFRYDFDKKGIYTIGLKATNQFCQADDRINIIVDETISMDESGFVPISVILHSEYLAFSMNQTLDSDVLLTVYDVAGRLLWSYKTNAQQGKVVETSISHFASGMYIIQGTVDGHELLNQKIIK